MTDDHHADYTCRWCGRPAVTPSLNHDHEARCVARPQETK